MKILYLTDRLGVHDERFLAALRHAGHTATAASLGDDGRWVIADSGRVCDADDLLAVRHDVIQFGPLAIAAHARPFLGAGPVVAVCWGTEGFTLDDDPTRALLAMAAVVVCDCEAIEQRLVTLGARPSTVLRVAWGIDLDRFDRRPRLPAGPERRIVATRAWEPFYAHDVVLRALAAARDAGHTDLRLTLYGAGSVGADLRALAHALGLAGVVAFHEPVAEHALLDVLGSCSGWVNAAPCDGTSISLLQAIAAGADIVTTDVVCAREALGPVPARLFPAGDVAALAHALCSVSPPGVDAVATRWRWLEAFGDWRVNRKRYVAAVEACAR